MPNKTTLGTYKPKVQELQALVSKDDRWLIIISADPDAIASAMALKRLISHRAEEVAIARINEIKRPDNLSMLAYSRTKMPLLTDEMLEKYNRFAVVDSQPSHHKEFDNIRFSIVIDHHPISEAHNITSDALIDIRPQYGACSSILMGYLQAANIRPGKMLATLMLYGVRTDTRNFSDKVAAPDLRVFRSLSRLADQEKLARITRSEFFMPWVKPFSKAINNISSIGTGKFIFFDKAHNSDLLVLTVDFLMRIHNVRWAAVAGIENDKLIVTMRSDGVRNVGKLASDAFGGYGNAGGHKTMARAEIPLENIPEKNLKHFVITCIRQASGRKNKPAPVGEKADQDSKTGAEKYL